MYRKNIETLKFKKMYIKKKNKTRKKIFKRTLKPEEFQTFVTINFFTRKKK